jgi:hypothetical protein
VSHATGLIHVDAPRAAQPLIEKGAPNVFTPLFSRAENMTPPVLCLIHRNSRLHQSLG